MATDVHLTPNLERYASDCGASGGYNNVSEIVRSALRLLQESDDRRRQFQNMLVEAEAEADRTGVIPSESLFAELGHAIRANAS